MPAGNPFTLLFTDDPVDLWKWNRTEVSCDVTSWRYQLTDGAYNTTIIYGTNVTFPDENSTEVFYPWVFLI